MRGWQHSSRSRVARWCSDISGFSCRSALAPWSQNVLSRSRIWKQRGGALTTSRSLSPTGEQENGLSALMLAWAGVKKGAETTLFHPLKSLTLSGSLRRPRRDARDSARGSLLQLGRPAGYGHACGGCHRRRARLPHVVALLVLSLGTQSAGPCVCTPRSPFLLNPRLQYPPSKPCLIFALSSPLAPSGLGPSLPFLIPPPPRMLSSQAQAWLHLPLDTPETT